MCSPPLSIFTELTKLTKRPKFGKRRYADRHPGVIMRTRGRLAPGRLRMGEGFAQQIGRQAVLIGEGDSRGCGKASVCAVMRRLAMRTGREWRGGRSRWVKISATSWWMNQSGNAKRVQQSRWRCAMNKAGLFGGQKCAGSCVSAYPDGTIKSLFLRVAGAGSNLKRIPAVRHQKLSTTAGFNNPVDWARTCAANPLEPADAFNIPVPERN
jgi:hypothetical protein